MCSVDDYDFSSNRYCNMDQTTSETEVMQRFKVELFQAASLADFAPGLYHGFTSMIAPNGGESFARSLGYYLQGSGIQDFQIDHLTQEHSSKIMFIAGERVVPFSTIARRGPLKEESGQFALVPPGGDGMVMQPTAGRFVAVQSADCVPILAVNPRLSQFAALHAGWRGVAGGILSKLLDEWLRRGHRLDGVRLAIGPSIRSCCYQVKDDCLSRFPHGMLEGAVSQRAGNLYLELTAVLLNQAHSFGVDEPQVEILRICTCCYDPPDAFTRFASYRRALRFGTATKARNAPFIGMDNKGAQSSLL